MRHSSVVYQLSAFACAAFLLFTAASCTRIVIYEGDGDVRIEREAGFVHLDFSPGTQPQLIDAGGVGFISREDGFTIGYFSSSHVLLPQDDCRVVVWHDSYQMQEELKKNLKGDGSVCMTSTRTQVE